MLNDESRCNGVLLDGEWREGCETCLRRTTPPRDPNRARMMEPLRIIVFECEEGRWDE